jgi:hypothetical protein
MPAAVILGLGAATGATAVIGGAIGSLIVGSAVSAVAATAIGTAVIAGTLTAAKGGSASDVLKSAVLGGVSGGVGAGIANSIASDVAFNAIASGVSGNTAVLMGNVLASAAGGALQSGTSALLQGQDPIEALIKGGLTAGLSTGVNMSINKLFENIPFFDKPTGNVVGDAIQRATKSAAATAILGGSGSDAFEKSVVNSFTNIAGRYIGNAIRDNSAKLKEDADAVKSAEQQIKDNVARQNEAAEKYNSLANQLRDEYSIVDAARSEFEAADARYEAASKVFTDVGANPLGPNHFSYSMVTGPALLEKGLNDPITELAKRNSLVENYNSLFTSYESRYNESKPILDQYQNTLNTLQAQLPELEKIYIAKEGALNGSVTEFQIQEAKNAALVLRAIEDVAVAKQIYKSDTGRDITDEELGRFADLGGDLITSVDRAYTSKEEASEFWKSIFGTEPTEFDLLEIIGLDEGQALATIENVFRDRGDQALLNSDPKPSDDQFALDAAQMTEEEIAKLLEESGLTGETGGQGGGEQVAGPSGITTKTVASMPQMQARPGEEAGEVRAVEEEGEIFYKREISYENPDGTIGSYSIVYDPGAPPDRQISYGTDSLDAAGNVFITSSKTRPDFDKVDDDFVGPINEQDAGLSDNDFNQDVLLDFINSITQKPTQPTQPTQPENGEVPSNAPDEPSPDEAPDDTPPVAPDQTEDVATSPPAVNTGNEAVSEVEATRVALEEAIKAAQDIGLAGDAALQAAIEAVAADQQTSAADLLTKLGTTEANLKTEFETGLAGVSTDIADTRKALEDAIQAAQDIGLEGDTALQTAIEAVAADLGTTKEALLTQLGTTEETLRTEFASGIAGLETQMKEQYDALTTEQKALADALTDQGTTLADAIAAAQESTATQISDLEAATNAQYEALTVEQKALADALTAQGTTLTDAIAAAQEQTQTQIGELATDVQAKFDALTEEQKALAISLEQQGVDLNTAIETAQQQTQQQISDLGVEVDARINELMQQGQTYQQATQQAIGELNLQNQQLRDLVGTQGRAPTRGDVDAIGEMLSGQRPTDLSYDVTGDGQVTQADLDFLAGVVGGGGAGFTPGAGSFLGPTGLYGQLAANEAQRQADLQAQQEKEEAAAEAEAERQRQAAIINAQRQRQAAIRNTIGRGQQQLRQISSQIPQALQMAQTTTTPIYGEMGPYLDLSSPLDFDFFKPSPEKQATTNRQQPTKIATGGYIDGLLVGDMSVDDLLNLLR